MLRWLLAVSSLLGVVGCAEPTPFRCDRAGATCEAPGVCVVGSCAVPASDCGSGLRYTSTAASPGACVAMGLLDAGRDDAPAVDAPAVDAPAVDAPDVPAVDAPDVPAVDVPAIDVPDAPAIDVPDAPAIDAPDAPAVDVPDVPDVPVVDVPDVPELPDGPPAVSSAVSFVTPIFSAGSLGTVIGMSTGDVDRDGNPDAFLARNDGRVDGFRGTGDGRFAFTSSLSTPGVRAVLVADVDTDGYADVLTLGDNLLVFAGSPAGLSPTAEIILTAPDGTSLRVGQVMGTPAPDVVIGRPAASRVTVVSGPVRAGVRSSQTFVSLIRPDAFELIDLDADGFAEVITLNASGSGDWIGVLDGALLGPGTSTTSSYRPAAMGSGATPRSWVTGDWNGDGDADLLLVDDGGVTFVDNGAGRTLTPYGRVVVGSPVAFGSAGRFNGDALADPVVAGRGDGLVHLYNSPATGTPTPVSFAVPGDVVATATGDFNRNGEDDLLVYADGFYAVLGHRDGVLRAPRAFRSCATPTAAAVANGAAGGRTVAVGCAGAPLVNLHGVGAGLADTGLTRITTQVVAEQMLAGDFDGDALVDVLIAHGPSTRAQLLRDVGGSLLVNTLFSSGARVAAGRFNGGGPADLAVVTGASLSTFRNTGGAFTFASTASVAGRTFSDVQLGDVMGDAHVEIVALDGAAGAFVIASVDHQGAPDTDYLTGSVRAGAGPFLLASLSSRTSLDLVVAHPTGASIEVYRASATGLSLSASSDVTGSGSAALMRARITRDACEDIVAARADGNRVHVLPGRCDGTLGPTTPLRSFLARSVTAGDLTGDGVTDLVVTHDAGAGRPGYFSVWVNNSP